MAVEFVAVERGQDRADRREEMFAYILRARTRPTEQTDEFFRRFKATSGLLHAFSLQGADDPEEVVAVAVWESRAAAEAYLASQLRQEVDREIEGVTRTMYEVRDST
jgi:heme-degrading monooxygenase HmoA